jgi:mannose-1-phosphate guanylyltransferase
MYYAIIMAGGSGTRLWLLSRRQNADDNVFVGPHIKIYTKNTLVFGDKRLVAVMGVRDLVIIDTDDVVMVCSREREQDVKLHVELLQQTQQAHLI